MAAVLGTTIGVLTHSILIAFGLSALITASPALFSALKITGALYLLWLAIDALRNGSSFHLTPSNMHGKAHANIWAVWLQGLTINLLNPKVVLFFLTFLPQFVSPADPNASAKLLFLGTSYAVITILVSAPVVLVALWLSNWLLANPGILRFIDVAFAGIFSAFALRILLTDHG